MYPSVPIHTSIGSTRQAIGRTIATAVAIVNGVVAVIGRTGGSERGCACSVRRQVPSRALAGYGHRLVGVGDLVALAGYAG